MYIYTFRKIFRVSSRKFLPSRHDVSKSTMVRRARTETRWTGSESHVQFSYGKSRGRATFSLAPWSSENLARGVFLATKHNLLEGNRGF